MSLLFVEAFGKLIPDENLGGVVSDEEDLYSVFRARSTLMGWYAEPDTRALLWAMHEAELTPDDDTDRIGFVQVGLDVGDFELAKPPSVPLSGYAPLPVRQRSVEPSLVLPALIQCFDDALRRFGTVEISGFQVSANRLESRMPTTRSYDNLPHGMSNWFNTTRTGIAAAHIAFDEDFLWWQDADRLANDLRWRGPASFEFGPVVALPDQHAVKAGVYTPISCVSAAHSGLGISVTLPEWTATAVGSALAIVIDAARANAPENLSSFTVRITRVR